MPWEPDAIEHTPWHREQFEYPGIRSMISGEERKYLHWLARTVWSGAGNLVEIGPWLGGSTACLAAGMMASGHEARGKLSVFDNFVWREFMAERAELPIEPGDSFEPFFRNNISHWAELIDANRCRLPDEVIAGDVETAGRRGESPSDAPAFRWNPEAKIEIIFVDGAKSWSGLRWLLSEVVESLIPGTSLLACQDFKDWAAYWVPAIMTRLESHLEPIHNTLSGGTVTFRLKDPIPLSELEAIDEDVDRVDTEACLSDLKSAAEFLRADGDRLGFHCVRLSQVRFLAHQGHLERAKECFREVQSTWPIHLNPSPLNVARAYVNQRTSVHIERPQPSRALAGVYQRGVRLTRRARGITGRLVRRAISRGAGRTESGGFHFRRGER